MPIRFPESSVIMQQTEPITQMKCSYESRSNANFWLLIGVIILFFLLVAITIGLLIVPAVSIKDDIKKVTDAVHPVQSNVDKLISNGEQTFQTIETFANDAIPQIEEISQEKEQTLGLFNEIKEMTELNDFSTDFCNLDVQLLSGGNINNSFRVGDGPNVANFCKNTPKQSEGILQFEGIVGSIVYLNLRNLLGFPPL